MGLYRELTAVETVAVQVALLKPEPTACFSTLENRPRPPREGPLMGRNVTSACGALQPLATTFPLVSGSLYRVLEIAAISVAVVTIW